MTLVLDSALGRSAEGGLGMRAGLSNVGSWSGYWVCVPPTFIPEVGVALVSVGKRLVLGILGRFDCYVFRRMSVDFCRGICVTPHR